MLKSHQILFIPHSCHIFPTEVLYIEAWGEIGDKLLQLCQVGDLVAIQGGTVQAAPATFSTSRLHYHLRLKGTLGITVLATKLTEAPWADVPDLHPLVPLRALSRVKDRQQICVAAVIIDNPGAIKRQTKEKMAMVCNAIIQQGNTKVRELSSWRGTSIQECPAAMAELLMLARTFALLSLSRMRYWKEPCNCYRSASVSAVLPMALRRR